MFEKKPSEEVPKVYFLNFYCENCEDSEEWEIPFGVTAEEFIKERECANCGCKTLYKSETENEE